MKRSSLILLFTLILTSCSVLEDSSPPGRKNHDLYNNSDEALIRIGRLKTKDQIKLVLITHIEGDLIDYADLSSDFSLSKNTIEGFFDIYSLNTLRSYMKRDPAIFEGKKAQLITPFEGVKKSIVVDRGYLKPKVKVSNEFIIDYYPKLSDTASHQEALLLGEGQLLDYGATLGLFLPKGHKEGEKIDTDKIGVILVNNLIDRSIELKGKTGGRRVDLFKGSSGKGMMRLGPYVVFSPKLRQLVKGQLLEVRRRGAIVQRMETSLYRYSLDEVISSIYTKKNHYMWPYEGKMLSLYNQDQKIDKGTLILLGTSDIQQLRPTYRPGVPWVGYTLGLGFIHGTYRNFLRFSILDKIKKKNLYLQKGERLIIKSTNLGSITTEFK